MLQRRIWGKSSERFINEDTLQRKLDFEGPDLLPEEKQASTSAKKEIEKYKTVRVIEKGKSHPIRKLLPESLPKEETHIYTQHINLAHWTELEPESTEVLERESPRWYVRRIIRHKYALKDKSQDVEKQIICATMPVIPIAKSYAGATVLADITIDKYVNHLPFYRQVQMIKQQGISIAPATIFTKTRRAFCPLGAAHARRKFEDALAEDKALASYALEQIGLLYNVERQADQQQLS